MSGPAPHPRPASEAPAWPPEFGLTHPRDDILVAYQHGQLDAAVSRGILAHLEVCDACREFLAGEPEDDEPSDVQAAVEGPPSLRRRVATIVIAVLAIATAGYLIFAPSALEPAPHYQITGLGGGYEIGAERLRFSPDHTLAVRLAPAEVVETVPVMMLFWLGPDDRLHWLPGAKVVVEPGAAVRLEARASLLFGEDYGRKDLIVLVAQTTDALSHVDGDILTIVEARPHVRVLRTALDYLPGVD